MLMMSAHVAEKDCPQSNRDPNSTVRNDHCLSNSSKDSCNSQCCVPGCRSGYKGEKKVILFQPPKDPATLSEWSRAIHRDNKQLSSRDKVCELHFQPTDIQRCYTVKVGNVVNEIEHGRPKLSVAAVPSVFSDFSKCNKIQEFPSFQEILPKRKTPIVQCYIEPVHEKSISTVQQSGLDCCKSELCSDVIPPQEITFLWLCGYGSTLCSRDWICYVNDDYACFGFRRIKDGQISVKLSVSISKLMEVEIFCNGKKATIPSISNTQVDTREKLATILDTVQKSQECCGISDDRLRHTMRKSHIGVLENSEVWRHKQCMRLSTTWSISGLCRHCTIFKQILQSAARNTRKVTRPSVLHARNRNQDVQIKTVGNVSKSREKSGISDDCEKEKSLNLDHSVENNCTVDVWKLENCNDDPVEGEGEKSMTKDESRIEELSKSESEIELKFEMSPTTDSQLNLATKKSSEIGVELQDFVVKEEDFIVKEEPECCNGENEIRIMHNDSKQNSINDVVIANEDINSDCAKMADDKSIPSEGCENHKDDKTVQDGISCCLVLPNAFYAAHLMQDIQTNSDEMIFKCKLCNKQFTVECCYQKHLKMHDQEWKCNICEKRFQSKAKLTRHKKHCKPRKLSTVVQREDFLGQNRSKIPSVSCRPYRCDLCPTGLGSEESLAAHKAMVHSGDSYFTVLDGSSKFLKCMKCDKKFRCKRDLNVHYREYHMKKEFKCKYCCKSFAQNSYLQNHLMVHEDWCNYQCDSCGRRLKSRSSMLRHKITHSKDRPYVCDQCGKSFSAASYLKTHFSQVHGIFDNRKKHVCDHCNRPFEYYTFLRRHLFKYTTGGVLTCKAKRSMKCKHCELPFTKISSWQEHMKVVHKDDYPFKCNVCGKMFRRKQQLSDHQYIHTEVRRFVCDRCGKTFKRYLYLWGHIHCCHPRNRILFSCKLCFRQFSSKSSFSHHMRMHSRKRSQHLR